MKTVFIFLFISFCCIHTCTAQENIKRKPAIGLTLSGGGAKGLAHIGILKAIDSAGLKVDYITGTSMGAILGALYASGYSGKQIEQLCKGLEWDLLFSNQVPLKSLSMEEKNQYARFALELPYINNKIKLPAGVIEGQELNIKFLELFFHVFDRKQFRDLPIPFQCMATDLETGNLVVLDSGNLVKALRASMAIPSVFTAVSINDKKLVDGGLVRNFPVKNVREMGADITIGSNVSGGLSTKEEISNAVDVILQMAFFKEASDFREEIPLTDIYIHMPLTKYNMSSFNSSKEIMQTGIDTGKNYYAVFKKLADSIGERIDAPPPVQRSKSVYIKHYNVLGLQKTSSGFFFHLMNFYDNRRYTAAEISKSIIRAYGSRYYSSITYNLVPVSGDTVNIEFNVTENPGTYLKAAVYYSIFRGINVNLNVTSRDFIIPNSRSMLSVALGESIQLETEHFQYLGRTKSIAVIPGFTIDRLNINTYTDFKKEGAYKQVNYRSYLNIQNSGNNKLSAGVGTAWEYLNVKPSVKSFYEQKGWLSYLKSYAYLNYNTLRQTFFPTRGIRLHTEFAFIYNQHANIRAYENGQPVASNLSLDNFSRFVLDGAIYVPLHKRFTFFSELQAGINFTNVPNNLNNFFIGGINGHFRNQIRFAGLQEATVNAATVSSLQLALRYTLFNNIYITGRVNGLVKDFATEKNATSNKSFLSGYSLTFAYKSPIGPLELSAMYADQGKYLQSYVTFGIPF